MNYIQLIIISLAVASISYTISKSGIFLPVRLFICKHIHFLGQLISCPYCLSNWVSFIIFITIYKSFSLDFIIMSFAAITLSAIWCGMIERSLDIIIQGD